MTIKINPHNLIHVDCARESHCGCWEQGRSACCYCKKESCLNPPKSTIICDHANEVPNRKLYLITHLKIMQQRMLESGRSTYDAQILKEVISILKGC